MKHSKSGDINCWKILHFRRDRSKNTNSEEEHPILLSKLGEVIRKPIKQGLNSDNPQIRKPIYHK